MDCLHPKISVVMPVWNGESYIQEAVQSILLQSFKNFELIVIDDGSTDRTPEILRGVQDSRLRVVNLNHGGIVLALNRGIQEARADWIARQDSDDISMPNRLECQWGAVQKNAEVVLCHTATEIFGNGEIPRRVARLPRSRSFTALRLCYTCPITHSTVLFNRKAALKAGGYHPDERHAEDYGLWGRMLELGDFAVLNTKLLKFRLHNQSVSQQNKNKQLELTRSIGARHCAQFMRLDEVEASRANKLLSTAPGSRSWADWCWFLKCCSKKLRWKSIESAAWIASQSLKLIFGKIIR